MKWGFSLTAASAGRFRVAGLVVMVACWALFANACFAEEVAILYTGQTHAMLYDCGCHNEPDGGVARRASLVKSLRKENPHLLLLDSGSFSASGIYDEYGQNAELDKLRTQLQLKAMEVMRYDAAALGEDELNFGSKFLKESIGRSKIAFLSANLKIKGARPYVLKRAGRLNIGIIGVTNPSAAKKAPDIEFLQAKEAVENAVLELKRKNANIIILLCNMAEEDSARLIEEIPGIDIVISGLNPKAKEQSVKVGSALLLRPAWQGRKLDKLTLFFEDEKIKDYKIEQIRLSEDVGDDEEVIGFLPACFSDRDCRKEGYAGTCLEPATKAAACTFTQRRKLKLTVITPSDCRVCRTEEAIQSLAAYFPGLTTVLLDFSSDVQAQKLANDLGLKTLPAFLLDKDAQLDKAFAQVQDNFELKAEFYVLKPQAGGIGYFLDRKQEKERFDLFISLFDEGSLPILEAVRPYSPFVHFLAVEENKGFDAKNGAVEVEEYLRSACVQEYYPQKFWDYILCRAKEPRTSWWPQCLDSNDTEKISSCARGETGERLLRENIRLNKELQILLGPTYLLDNREVFSSQGPPSKQELDDILNKK